VPDIYAAVPWFAKGAPEEMGNRGGELRKYMLLGRRLLGLSEVYAGIPWIATGAPEEGGGLTVSAAVSEAGSESAAGSGAVMATAISSPSPKGAMRSGGACIGVVGARLQTRTL